MGPRELRPQRPWSPDGAWALAPSKSDTACAGTPRTQSSSRSYLLHDVVALYAALGGRGKVRRREQYQSGEGRTGIREAACDNLLQINHIPGISRLDSEAEAYGVRLEGLAVLSLLVHAAMAFLAVDFELAIILWGLRFGLDLGPDFMMSVRQWSKVRQARYSLYFWSPYPVSSCLLMRSAVSG